LRTQVGGGTDGWRRVLSTNIANVNDFAALDRNGGSLGIVVIDGDDLTVEVDGIGSLRSGVVRRAATEQAGCNG
jgi:hypothetical protein